MDYNLKSLSEELGISRQAIYKRATGKLKAQLEPYTYLKYNTTFYTKEGADIIKADFAESPCATSVSRTSSVSNSKADVLSTDLSNPVFEKKTSVLEPNTHTTVSAVSDTVDTGITSDVSNKVQDASNTYVHSANGSAQITNDSSSTVSDTELLRITYERQTKIQEELDELKRQLHEKDIALVKATSETNTLNAIINQLNTRIADKDEQLQQQQLTLAKTDNERKILTASLFRNNEFIEKLMRLSLSKRIFGWKDVQKSLIDNQSSMADDIDVQTEAVNTVSNEEKE